MSTRKCDCASLLDDLASGLLSKHGAAECDAFMQEWSERVIKDCGPEALHTVLALKLILNAKGMPQTAPEAKTKLVILLHGIRDQGAWMDMVEHELQQIPNVRVQSVDFRFFDSLCFMSGFRTNYAIQTVLRKILASVDEVKPHELIVIAHSFGTYVITDILAKGSFLKVDHAIFCGSVVSTEVEFNNFRHPPKIVNECGGRDLWPVIAQGFRFFTAGKYGAAGVFGLRQIMVKNRHHDFGHSAYLKRSFVQEFWVPYISNGEWVQGPYDLDRRPIPYGISYLAEYGWYLIFFWTAFLSLALLLIVPLLPVGYQSIASRSTIGVCAAFWTYILICIAYYLWVSPKKSTAAT